jgi:outer membrane protein assembly factor BamB
MLAGWILAALAQGSPLQLENDVTRLHSLGSRLIAAGRDVVYSIDPAGWKVGPKMSLDAMKGQRFLGIAGGLVVTSLGDTVATYDADLKPVWTAPQAKGSTIEAVDVSGGVLLIVQGKDGQAARLIESGKGTAKASLEPGFKNAVVRRAAADLVLFAEKEKEEGHFAAFDGSGKKLWAEKIPRSRMIAASDDAILVSRSETDGGTTLMGVDLRTGGERFGRKLAAGVGCAGLAGGDALIFEHAGFSGTKLTAVDGSGKDRWTATLPVAPRRVLSVGGTLIVENSRGVLGLDPSNGARRWEHKRRGILELKAVGLDVFDPVAGLAPPGVMLAAMDLAKGALIVWVVDATAGTDRTTLEVPQDPRTALLVGKRWIVAVERSLLAFDLVG